MTIFFIAPTCAPRRMKAWDWDRLTEAQKLALLTKEKSER